MPKPPSTAPEKPVWPYPHVTNMTADMGRNQWVKRINGTRYSFGVLADPAAALKRYQREGPALHAGLEPDREDPTDIALEDVCGLYVQAKLAAVEAGDLQRVTFDDYRRTAEQLISIFGPRRRVRSLKPRDFEALLRKVPYGPTRRANFVTWTRMVFSWAHDSEVIDFLPRYGKAFKGGSAKERRELRNRTGKSLFTAEQVRTLILEARPVLRAVILLGINSGIGNKDCAALPMSAVNLETGMVDFPRIKTGVERRFPLWPETRKAIERYLEERPTPMRKADADYLFLTVRRRPWFHGRTNAIKSQFRDHMARCGVIRFKPGTMTRCDDGPPLGYYTLRRTFRTVADAVGDQHAVHLVMGHTIPGMAGIYVQRIDDERLWKVVNHVRSWVFG